MDCGRGIPGGGDYRRRHKQQRVQGNDCSRRAANDCSTFALVDATLANNRDIRSNDHAACDRNGRAARYSNPDLTCHLRRNQQGTFAHCTIATPLRTAANIHCNVTTASPSNRIPPLLQDLQR